LPGIDPTFLEALPAALREEVLASHAAEQARFAAGESDAVSPEFLAALPPELQIEVLQQQARERRQRERRARPTGPAAAPTAADIDNASFIASLAPELREEVSPALSLSSLGVCVLMCGRCC
jgi:E3 ubiquitin-protein ligase HUWE1